MTSANTTCQIQKSHHILLQTFADYKLSTDDQINENYQMCFYFVERNVLNLG